MGKGTNWVHLSQNLSANHFFYLFILMYLQFRSFCSVLSQHSFSALHRSLVASILQHIRKIFNSSIAFGWGGDYHTTTAVCNIESGLKQKRYLLLFDFFSITYFFLQTKTKTLILKLKGYLNRYYFTCNKMWQRTGEALAACFAIKIKYICI